MISIAYANSLFKQEKYEAALGSYRAISYLHPPLEAAIAPNIERSKKKILRSLAQHRRPKIGIFVGDTKTNAIG